MYICGHFCFRFVSLFFPFPKDAACVRKRKFEDKAKRDLRKKISPKHDGSTHDGDPLISVLANASKLCVLKGTVIEVTRTVQPCFVHSLPLISLFKELLSAASCANNCPPTIVRLSNTPPRIKHAWRSPFNSILLKSIKKIYRDARSWVKKKVFSKALTRQILRNRIFKGRRKQFSNLGVDKYISMLLALEKKKKMI